jgi:CDP-diacylglycerol---glycerol-3-phosphate 3-phosphatidyltransferase
VNIPASPMGKVKMIAEVIAILGMILGQQRLGRLYVLAPLALWVAVVTAVVSAIDYYRKFQRGQGGETRLRT